jgi:hypothetical protein
MADGTASLYEVALGASTSQLGFASFSRIVSAKNEKSFIRKLD